MRSAPPPWSPTATSISRCAPRPAQPVAILWRGHEVARLGPGKNLLSPRILLDRRIDRVSDKGREAVILRLKDWLRAGAEAVLGAAARGRPCRAGSRPRRRRCAPCSPCSSTRAASSRARLVAGALAALDKEQRRAVTRLGVRIGALDLLDESSLRASTARDISGWVRL